MPSCLHRHVKLFIALAVGVCAVGAAAQPAQATILCTGPGMGACKGGLPNGVCQAGEACDDGNTINGDSCDNNCTVPACGNGITTSGEECDNGASNDDINLNAPVPGNACDTHCRLKKCGNGRVEGGEQCDDSNAFNDDGCDSDPANNGRVNGNCLVSGCGNGISNMGEVCDDGDTSNGDGCDDGTGGNCTPTGCPNGVKTGTEACDDGNTINGDGCDSNCTFPACGNGVSDAGEKCDDGNKTNGDGCDSNCTPTTCGNGISTAPEQCDDGNTVRNDACDNTCLRNICGDGQTTGGEECDSGACSCVAPKHASDGRSCASMAGRVACAADGGTCINKVTLAVCGVAAGDGNLDDIVDACRSTCQTPFCGDGVTDASEVCDDGWVGAAPQAGDDTDSCPNGPMMLAMGMGCQGVNVCGDGTPNTDAVPFTCDNGFGTNLKTCLKTGVPCSLDSDCGTDGPCGNSNTRPDACRTNCQPAHCGDGVTDSNESCDDGDTVDGANCHGNCALPSCGDGVVKAPEACDSGANNGVNKTCTDTCKVATCGDGKVCNTSGCTSGPTGGQEECDDGNLLMSDDCDSCRLNVCGDGVTRTSGTLPLEQCDDGNQANQDGCSANCCNEPGPGVPGGLHGLFAGQQCTLDHMALDVASLPPAASTNDIAARRKSKTINDRAVRRLATIQSLARDATVSARDISKPRSRKRVKLREKRIGRLLINVQRVMDNAYQNGGLTYPQYANISAQRVASNGYVNLIIDTMFNTH